MNLILIDFYHLKIFHEENSILIGYLLPFEDFSCEVVLIFCLSLPGSVCGLVVTDLIFGSPVNRVDNL